MHRFHFMGGLNPSRLFTGFKLHRSIWTFAIRATIASSAAFYLAHILKLESPAWAPITVWTIAQPSRGMTMSKSFYRLFGTCIGALVALPMILYLSKTPWVFVAALALWMGLCSAVANVVLYFRSYAAILAGFTATIVGLLAFSHTERVYEVALSRVACIFIGIGTTAVFSTLLGGRRAKHELFLKIQSAIVSSLEWLAAIANRASAPERRLLERQLLAEVSAIEELTSYAAAESLQIRLRIRRLHKVIGSLLSVLSSARSFDSLLDRRDQVVSTLRNDLIEISELAHKVSRTVKDLNLVPAEAFEALQRSFAQLASRLTGDSIHQSLLSERSEELINALATVTADFKSLKAEGTRTTSSVHISHHRDWKSARLSAIRSIVGVSIAGTIWLATEWHLGPVLVMIAAVNCGVFAARPDSTAALMTGIKSSAFSFVAAFVTYALFLSNESTTAAVILSQVPFLMVGGLLIANTSTALIGALFTANYLVFLSPEVPMTFNVRHFIDLGLGFFGGALLSYVTYRFLIPAHPRRMTDSLREKIVEELERITRARSTQSERQWGTRMYHRISRLILLANDPQAGATGMVDSAMAALFIGRGVLRLKGDLARAESSADLKLIISQALALIGELSRAPLSTVEQLDKLVSRARRLPATEGFSHVITQRTIITLEEIAEGLSAHETFFAVRKVFYETEKRLPHQPPS